MIYLVKSPKMDLKNVFDIPVSQVPGLTKAVLITELRRAMDCM
jgi:hypothetical protein